MERGIDVSHPVARNLVSAFLAMESTDYLVQLARELGGGSTTTEVQSFILQHCINNSMIKSHPSTQLYIRKFLKKVIVTAESCCSEVLDEIYEHFMLYMNSFKEDAYFESKAKVCRCISFILPDGYYGNLLPSGSKKLLIPLWCSLNMLEGDTGCCIWPSSFFLSEFILSYPEVFSNKSCFEVGSGVGLVGICLVQAKASKVILSDGDFSTLSNMQLNLELNHVNISSGSEERNSDNHNKTMLKPSGQPSNVPHSSSVECLYLPWESASDGALQGLNVEIILGADVIYNPSCVPHLVHILAMLLNPQSSSFLQKASCVHENRSDGLVINGNGDHDTTLCWFTDRSDGANRHRLEMYEEVTDPNSHGGGDAYHLKSPSDETNSFIRPNAALCSDESKKAFQGFEFGAISANGLDENFDHENGPNGNYIGERKAHPLAYIATVIRNRETFNHFLGHAKQAQLSVVDMTEVKPPLNFLPYMHSYDRTSVRLLKICYAGTVKMILPGDGPTQFRVFLSKHDIGSRTDAFGEEIDRVWYSKNDDNIHVQCKFFPFSSQQVGAAYKGDKAIGEQLHPSALEATAIERSLLSNK